jgi:hypothetical protein
MFGDIMKLKNTVIEKIIDHSVGVALAFVLSGGALKWVWPEIPEINLVLYSMALAAFLILGLRLIYKKRVHYFENSPGQISVWYPLDERNIYRVYEHEGVKWLMHPKEHLDFHFYTESLKDFTLMPKPLCPSCECDLEERVGKGLKPVVWYCENGDYKKSKKRTILHERKILEKKISAISRRRRGAIPSNKELANGF